MSILSNILKCLKTHHHCLVGPGYQFAVITNLIQNSNFFLGVRLLCIHKLSISKLLQFYGGIGLHGNGIAWRAPYHLPPGIITRLPDFPSSTMVRGTHVPLPRPSRPISSVRDGRPSLPRPRFLLPCAAIKSPLSYTDASFP
jgi:hypothetical protein